MLVVDHLVIVIVPIRVTMIFASMVMRMVSVVIVGCLIRCLMVIGEILLPATRILRIMRRVARCGTVLIVESRTMVIMAR